MMVRRQILIYVSAAVLHASAVTAQINQADTADLGRVLGAGVQCLLAPSAAYKPGTVFRIDGHNVSYFVNASLADSIPSHSLSAMVGDLTGRQEMSVGVFAWLLNASKAVDLHASADSKRTIDAKFEGVTWEVTEDVQIDNIIPNWFAQYRHKRADSQYYVVREAWLAKSFRLKLTKGLTDDLGGEGSLQRILHLNARFQYQPAAEYNLSVPFPEALRVCIKPELLVPISGRGDAYQTEPVRKRLTVVRQEVDID